MGECTATVVQNHFDFARNTGENSLVVPTGEIHLQPRETRGMGLAGC